MTDLYLFFINVLQSKKQFKVVCAVKLVVRTIYGYIFESTGILHLLDSLFFAEIFILRHTKKILKDYYSTLRSSHIYRECSQTTPITSALILKL